VTGASATTDFLTHAFLWDPVTGMRDLGTLGGPNSSGSGVNDNGQVTGWGIVGTVTYAFLWDPVTGMRDLGTLGGILSFSSGINASGQVTGFSETADGLGHAFLWDGMSMFDLNDLIDPGLGWTLIDGRGINDTGQITGAGVIGGQGHAFLLTPVRVVEVPEPGTLALIGTGIIGLSLLRQRKRRTDTATQAPAA
jgi:probable HAF family extracellular repeat protein